MQSTDYPYKKHLGLAAYIDRIGAEQLNFRKFMVREWTERQNGKRYYTQRAIIEITRDGDITCSDPGFAPTADEAARIKLEARDFKWPEVIGATISHADDQRKALGLSDENWYPCYDRARAGVLWCQARKDRKSGDKDYYPWTYWSDGKWRQMEPDGPLPFWKPHARRHCSQIMIHEGAKAARFVDWLCFDESIEARNARKTHPWAAHLAFYEHWGMMGGALSPHRADYAELRAEKPSEVIYVCDRDNPGEGALQKVSRAYRGSLIGLKFDGRWPAGWDLADEFPKTKAFFQQDVEGVEHYVGPRMAELIWPATWATDVVLVEKKPRIVLRQEFKDEWVHVVSPEAFINRRQPSRVYYKSSEFNSRVRPFSEARDTAEELKKDDKGKVDTLTYSPALPSGIVAGSPRAFNTHQPSRIRAVSGNSKPFADYIGHLLPIEADQKELLRWVATLIARPEIKMTYGILMISETQGVGKSTLAEKILTPLLGTDNVSFPSDSEISEGQFNSWKAHKRLAVINEIYQGESAKVYNKLKDLITDKNVRVNEKFVVPYTVENWCHVFACSNSLRALKLPDDDRRWFVPKVTEEKLPLRYWIEFNSWLATTGLPIIRQWANDFLKQNDPVETGAHAPDSSAKRKMVEEGYSPGQSLVADWLDTMKSCAMGKCSCDREKKECRAGRVTGPDDRDERGTPVAVTDKALVAMIKSVIYEGRQTDKLERDRTIRKLARDRGWFTGEKPEFIAPGKPKATIISTDRELAAKTPAELRAGNPAVRVIEEPPM